MKITKQKLKQIIKEELQKALKEQHQAGYGERIIDAVAGLREVGDNALSQHLMKAYNDIGREAIDEAGGADEVDAAFRRALLYRQHTGFTGPLNYNSLAQDWVKVLQLVVNAGQKAAGRYQERGSRGN